MIAGRRFKHRGAFGSALSQCTEHVLIRVCRGIGKVATSMEKCIRVQEERFSI